MSFRNGSLISAMTGVLLVGTLCLAETPSSENWHEASQNRQKSQREWYRRWRENPPRHQKDAEALEYEMLRIPDLNLQLAMSGRTPISADQSQAGAPSGQPNKSSVPQNAQSSAPLPAPEPMEIQDAPPSKDERFPGKERKRTKPAAR